MISAHGLEAYREKGENLHFAGFLVKPVNPVTLWNTILKALGKNPASPRLADMDGTEDGALSQRRGTVFSWWRTMKSTRKWQAA